MSGLHRQFQLRSGFISYYRPPAGQTGEEDEGEGDGHADGAQQVPALPPPVPGGQGAGHGGSEQGSWTCYAFLSFQFSVHQTNLAQTGRTRATLSATRPTRVVEAPSASWPVSSTSPASPELNLSTWKIRGLKLNINFCNFSINRSLSWAMHQRYLKQTIMI